MTMMRSILFLSALLPASALAAPEPVPPAVQRLSESQVEQVLADAATKREAVEAETPNPKLAIHGEVGVEVGTGGHRAAYGTAVVPIGEDGQAAVSFVTSTDREYYSRRHR